MRKNKLVQYCTNTCIKNDVKGCSFMLSIKDFARDYGVSYEAVRQQVKRYQVELDGHIHRQGRTQYLDDVAVAFLSEHRSKPAMVVYDAGDDRRVQELQEKVNSLLEDKADREKKISELSEWKAEHAIALAAAEQTRLALAASQAAQKALEASRDEYKAEADKNAQRASEEAQKAAEAMQDYRQAADALDKMRDEAFMRLQQAEAAEEREQEALREAQILREQLEVSEARREALETEKEAFRDLPWWKKLFWKGE